MKLANAKVGDIFEYKGVMYEVISVNKWDVTCAYINDLYDKIRYTDKYLYCNFSKYLKV